jgi:ABC-type phosphate transport system substrate-binding protein
MEEERNVRMLSKVVAAAAIAATATMTAIGPASADPVTGAGKAVTPKAYDLVGVGSNTIEYLLDQLSVDYNGAQKVHNATHPFIYSWDATNPKTGAIGDLISTKSGCAKIARPNGSGSGITALMDNAKDPKAKSDYCIDFSRSSSGRSTQPSGKGGVLFVALAKDAVSYARLTTGSYAPKNLTTAQLRAIYLCTDTTWGSVGGTKGKKIEPVLPQASSGTRAFFLAQIGVTTPGKCVYTNNSLEENEGTAKVFQKNKNAIVPFSVGKWLAQAYHSPACNKKPGKTQNEFGCDVNGDLSVQSINGFKPTAGTGNKQTVNPHFAPAFVRTVYDVVRYATNTADHIPSLENPIFGPKGYFCTSKDGKAAIVNYGFLTTPLCGLGF